MVSKETKYSSRRSLKIIDLDCVRFFQETKISISISFQQVGCNETTIWCTMKRFVFKSV